MKEKVRKRLEELESKDYSKNNFIKAYANFKIGKNIEKLIALTDAIDNNDMGFVSNYKGSCYFVVNNSEIVKEYNKTVNNKIENINNEYLCAMKILDTLESLNCCMKFNQQDTTSLMIINSEANKALDACIKKGYNYPAMRILESMCDGRKTKQIKADLPHKTTLEVQSYLKKIMANYAKKNMYQDNASYLTITQIGGIRNTDIKRREVSSDYLLVAIKNGNFGDQQVFIPSLLEHYDHVINSGKKNDKTLRLQSLDNLKEM